MMIMPDAPPNPAVVALHRVDRRMRTLDSHVACRLIILCAICAWLPAAGCDRDKSTSSSGGLTPIRVGYIGLTCEAPIFSAYENGFFREEGLDVEFIKCEWA